MQHILSAEQFSTAQLDEIFKHTDSIKEQLAHDASSLTEKYRGKIVATLFYEPSTRTRLSFESAAARLGAGIISTENAAEFSSAVKGETLEDTIRVVDKLADIIVLRHMDDDAAERAASVSGVPILNGGAGVWEHPTQALLDMYTIHQRLGRTNNLKIVIGGDLKHGRTARSVARLAALYPGNQLTFVSTPELQIGRDILDYLDSLGIPHVETDELTVALSGADVVYWTRVQKERLKDPSIVSQFSITPKEMKIIPRSAIVMHPLPRTNEIHPDVDSDPRAVYFEQVENGLYVRMALLDQLLSEAKG